MKIKTNRFIGNIFGDEVFADTWIIVTDRNGCDVQVTVDDLIQDISIGKNIYERVYYDNQSWWISKNLHFPM